MAPKTNPASLRWGGGCGAPRALEPRGARAQTGDWEPGCGHSPDPPFLQLGAHIRGPHSELKVYVPMFSRKARVPIHRAAVPTELPPGEETLQTWLSNLHQHPRREWRSPLRLPTLPGCLLVVRMTRVRLGPPPCSCQGHFHAPVEGGLGVSGQAPPQAAGTVHCFILSFHREPGPEREAPSPPCSAAMGLSRTRVCSPLS